MLVVRRKSYRLSLTLFPTTPLRGSGFLAHGWIWGATMSSSGTLGSVCSFAHLISLTRCRAGSRHAFLRDARHCRPTASSMLRARRALEDYLAYDLETQLVAEYLTKVDSSTMHYALEAG